VASWSKEVLTHIKEHIFYPADGMEIINDCQNMIEVADSEEHKRFERKISKSKTYRNAEKVLEDLNSK